MSRPNFEIPEKPTFDLNIPTLLDSDPASATLVFNPLFQQLVSNLQALYLVTQAQQLKIEELEQKLENWDPPEEPEEPRAPGEYDGALRLDDASCTRGRLRLSTGEIVDLVINIPATEDLNAPFDMILETSPAQPDKTYFIETDELETLDSAENGDLIIEL